MALKLACYRTDVVDPAKTTDEIDVETISQLQVEFSRIIVGFKIGNRVWAPLFLVRVFVHCKCDHYLMLV